MRWVVGIAAGIMLAASAAAAQGPRILQELVLTAAGGGRAEGMAATDDGGVVAAGQMGGSPRVVHLDPHLHVIDDWVLPGSDARPRAVTALPGAVAVVAGPADPVGFEHGLAVWRLALDGGGHLHQDWLRRFRRSPQDGGGGAVALEDGGLVVAGWSGSPSTGGGDAWILRLDADGIPAWRRLAWPTAAGGTFEARAAARAPGGDILVAAHGSPGPDQPGGVWLIRFDLQGNDTEQKVIEEVADIWPQALIPLQDGGWIVAGRAEPVGKRLSPQAWLVRLTPDGNIAWDRRWGEAGDSSVDAVAPLPDGGVLVTGWVSDNGTPVAWLARLDAGGGSVWEHRFAGRGAQRFHALALLADGSAIAAGSKTVGGRDQMWMVHFDY